MIDPIVIVVTPVGRGKFSARLDGGLELVSASATPFLTGCRKLLDLGYDPRQRAVMRHVGSDVDALSATIGAAAGMTVAESGTPRFARLPKDGFSSRDGSPGSTPNHPAGTTGIPGADFTASEASEASHRGGGCA